MSLESWKDEYYVNTKKASKTWKKALGAVMLKYIGSDSSTLADHSVKRYNKFLKDDQLNEESMYDVSHCALCLKAQEKFKKVHPQANFKVIEAEHYEEICDICILPMKCIDAGSPWHHFIINGNPQPMLKMLANLISEV